MRPSLSLAIIAKNEEENLRNCLQSVRQHVDEIVVVDTGSTDSTRAVATQFGASVYDFSPQNHPDAFLLDNAETCREFGYDIPDTYSGELHFADFAAARNVSFDQCRCDYVLWVDADDVVDGAEHLPEIVSDLQSRGMDLGFLAYDYARDEKGRVFYRQWRERIVRRGVARWVNAVHEVLLPTKPVQVVKYEKTKMVHNRKPTRAGLANRNYKILLRQLKREFPKPDPRTLFYLGQESRFLEPQRAIGFYEAYQKASGWPEERAAAHAALGAIYEFGLSGLPPEEALSRANRDFAASAVELPDNPDGLFGLARVAYLRGRWNDCIAYTERGFKIGNPESMLGANPMDRLYRPHVYYNHALANVGKIAEAAQSCRDGLKVCPDDPGVPGGASGMLALNLKIYEQKLAEGEKPNMKKIVDLGKDEDLEAPAAELPTDVYAIWTIQIWKQNMARGDGARARQLLESVPPALSHDPVFARMREITDRRFPVTEKKIEIKVNAPPGTDPESFAKQVSQQVAKQWDVIQGGKKAAPSEPPQPANEASMQKLAKMFGKTPAPARNDVSESPAFQKSRGKSAYDRRVVIWVGPAFEPWDPTTLNTKGIGGSETAVIEMGRELTKLGCKVVVYGDCEKTAGIYDDVEYRHYATFTGEDCDVFISSRVPAVMQYADRIKARLKLLWVHDIHCGPPTPDMSKWLLCFDRILCLSKWHRDYFLSVYPAVAPETVLVTRNGINLSRFASEPVKQGNRLIYSSSPNRGLDALLQMFPLIREQVPDAELHVYYGFDTWEKFAKMRNDQTELADIQRYKDLLMAAQAKGGVAWHGRVPQSELAQAFLASKVWAYPTTFPETSCITAMEAQAAGCVPVTSKFAALAETVKHGILIPFSNTYGRQWVDAVVRALKDEPFRTAMASAGRAYALENLSWASLARDWAQMFDRLSEEVSANPVAAWRAF